MSSNDTTHRFLVSTNMVVQDSTHEVDAAYYVHEDRFTVFKATDGGILASFANDHLVSIEREPRTDKCRPAPVVG